MIHDKRISQEKNIHVFTLLLVLFSAPLSVISHLKRQHFGRFDLQCFPVFDALEQHEAHSGYQTSRDYTI